MNQILSETQIFSVFSAIESTSSLTSKIEILRNIYEKFTEEVEWILLNIVSGETLTYIGENTLFKMAKPGEKYIASLSEFKSLISNLSGGNLRGTQGINAVRAFLSRTDEFHFKWYYRLILKDLRIGIGKTIIEKILGFSVDSKPIDPMLATSLEDLSSIDYLLNAPLLLENKYDGIRCISIVDDITARCFTRNGKRLLKAEGLFSKDLIRLARNINGEFNKPFIFDGEIFASDWNSSVRINSNRKSTLDQSEIDVLNYYIFDIVIEDTPLTERKNILQDAIDEISLTDFPKLTSVQIVPYEVVDIDFKEKDTFLLYCNSNVNNYDEGFILKVADSFYEYKRSKNWVKVKHHKTEEFLCVGIEESIKNPSTVSAITIQYGNTTVNVSGLEDTDSKIFFINPELVIGKYVEVKHYGESSNGKLRHPVFICVRDDK